MSEVIPDLASLAASRLDGEPPRAIFSTVLRMRVETIVEVRDFTATL